jgi:hypothetical protein
VGPDGQGEGAVIRLRSWGESTGKWIPKESGAKPGDIIIYNGHTGIVEKVGAGGEITAIEGNTSNGVYRRENRQGVALGFVRLG